MNSEVVSLRDTDENLCNVLIASGPGEGINRDTITLRDNASITRYGVYRQAVTFDAVDVEELREKAQKHLRDHASPQQTLEVHVNGPLDVSTGDRVRVSDPTLGLHTEGVVEEFSWAPDGTTLHLGDTAPSLVSSVLDREEAEERQRRALGLPAPTGLMVRTAQPGISVRVNPFAGNSRASGVEIHASIDPAFEPNQATLRDRGQATRFHLSDLEPGVRWYVRARSYDAAGEVGEATDPVSAKSGHVATGSLDPELIDQIRTAEAAAKIVEADREVWDRAASFNEAGKLLTSYLEGEITREQLDEVVREQLDQGNSAYGAIQSNAEVWDRAAALTETGRLATEYLEGRITKQQLSDAVQGELDLIEQTRTTLALDADDPEQFTAIKQNNEMVRFTAAKFQPYTLTDSTGAILVDESGRPIVTNRPAASDELGVTEAFTELTLTKDQIQALASDQAGAWSALTQTAQEFRTEVGRVEAGLDGDPADSPYSSVRQTAERIQSLVGSIGDPDDPESGTLWTELQQTAERLRLTAAKFEPYTLTDSGGSVLVDETGRPLVTNLPVASDDLGVTSVYSMLTLTMDEIHSLVRDMGRAWSSIRQQADEIDARVKVGDVVASANLSPEGVRLQGRLISLDGDTEVNGDFQVSGGNVKLDANTEIDGDFKVSGGNVELDGDTSITGDLSVGSGRNLVRIGPTAVSGQAGIHLGRNAFHVDGAGMFLGGISAMLTGTLTLSDQPLDQYSITVVGETLNLGNTPAHMRVVQLIQLNGAALIRARSGGGSWSDWDPLSWGGVQTDTFQWRGRIGGAWSSWTSNGGTRDARSGGLDRIQARMTAWFLGGSNAQVELRVPVIALTYEAP